MFGEVSGRMIMHMVVLFILCVVMGIALANLFDSGE